MGEAIERDIREDWKQAAQVEASLRRGLVAEVDRLRAVLMLIADISEGSTTANSLPNIARIARDGLLNT